jgi:hypothetical protein
VNGLPSLHKSKGGEVQWIVLSLLLWGIFVFLFGPLTALSAFLLERKGVSVKALLLLTPVSIFFLVLVLGFFNPLDFTRSNIYWVFTLPLTPVAILTIKGLYRFSALLKPRSIDEQLRETVEQMQAFDLRLSAKAQRRREIPLVKGWLRLGATIVGDAFPEHTGITESAGWLLMDEKVLDQHIFLLGTTGAGKSETIKRLVQEILTATERNLYFVDGKGDEDLADDIRSLSYHHGRGVAPVFKLGFEQFGAIYHAFCGFPADVYNRLCALAGVTEAEGNAQYYADINRDLLQLVCFAPFGPPRNFEEVRVRLNRKWLLDAYQDNEEETATIEREITDKDILGLSRRIRPLAREFGSCIGDEGFSLETARCAIFSMRTQSVGDTSRRFINFLIEDMKDFIGKRQTHPSVLIIDEFGQFSNDNITALLSLARSAELGIILATQDTASLTSEVTKKLVLANTRTKFLMTSEFPEEVAALAGTSYQLESSLQHEEGELTGLASARVQHAFKVDMNEVANLKPGQAFVIRQRHAAKIQVKRIEKIPRIERQQVEIRRKPAASIRRKPPTL